MCLQVLKKSFKLRLHRVHLLTHVENDLDTRQIHAKVASQRENQFQSFQVGIDSKWGVTPSLTLDATVNTDFAQVEADEEQVNLTRFDLFFPEKRPFFLENASTFQFGQPQSIDLFFSRRIGLSGAASTLLPIPIIAGGRLSGKVAGFQQRVVGQSLVAGTAFAAMIKDGVDPTAVEGSAPEQYEIENAHVTWNDPKVGIPVLWWRSVGHSHMAFSKEVIIEELAEAAGQDPVAFRLGMLSKSPRQAAVLVAGAVRRLPDGGRGVGSQGRHGEGDRRPAGGRHGAERRRAAGAAIVALAAEPAGHGGLGGGARWRRPQGDRPAS